MNLPANQFQNAEFEANNVEVYHTFCRYCNGPHLSIESQMVNPLGELEIEQAQYLAKFPPPQNFNPYAQNFNLGWKNHPKLSWRNQNVMNPMEQMKLLLSQEKNSSLEETMKKLTNMQMKMQKSQN